VNSEFFIAILKFNAADLSTFVIYGLKRSRAPQTTTTTENPEITRVFYAIKDMAEKKPYVIGIRVVQTKDFLTAQVSETPWATLDVAAEKIIEQCSNVSTVYYDVTPKPPATIEME
jgi:hypothetical protein